MSSYTKILLQRAKRKREIAVQMKNEVFNDSLLLILKAIMVSPITIQQAKEITNLKSNYLERLLNENENLIVKQKEFLKITKCGLSFLQSKI